VEVPIEAAPSKNSTDPVGVAPATVAVSTVGDPMVTLAGAAFRLVVVRALLTSTMIAAETEVKLPPSPEYAALRLWEPTAGGM
jgi:hypothetical protein